MPAPASETLKKLYYNAELPTAFGGAHRLHKGTKNIKLARIKKWLEGQRTYTLHKPANRNFPRRRVLAYDRNELWEADLAQMLDEAPINNDYKYILTVIDVLTKYAYAVPLKNKTADEIIRGFTLVFAEAKDHPKLLHTDKGGEFLGHRVQNFLKKRNVKHYVTQNEDIKASVVERFNRTLKDLMYRYFTYKNSKRYIDILPKLLHSYNNSWHRSIRMRPADVTTREKIAQAYKNLFPNLPPSAKAPSDLKVGDYVRMLYPRKVFARGFKSRWTEEVFIVSARVKHEPFEVFTVRDLDGEDVHGSFYAQELQKVNKPDTFVVDEVLKTRKRRGQPKEYFVSWKGYGPKFNSWTTDIEQI